MEEDVAKYREALLDATVELDDDIMEAYLEVGLPPCHETYIWGGTYKLQVLLVAIFSNLTSKCASSLGSPAHWHARSRRMGQV